MSLLSEGAGSPTGKMALAYFHLLADYSVQVTLSMNHLQDLIFIDGAVLKPKDIVILWMLITAIHVITLVSLLAY